jgi:hypothetical protein
MDYGFGCTQHMCLFTCARILGRSCSTLGVGGKRERKKKEEREGERKRERERERERERVGDGTCYRQV